MADGLSIAASVAGLVSLGIQVTTGISKYLDAVEARNDELSSVKRQNEALRHIIAIIEKATDKLQQVSPDAATAAKESVKNCRGGLVALENFVVQLTSPNGSTIRSRLKNSRYHYVFDRPKVQQLSAQLGQTNSALQLAVDGLGVSTVAVIHESVAGIQGRIPGLESTIASVRDQQLIHHQETAKCVVDNTTQLSNQMTRIRDTSESLVEVQRNHFERAHVQTENLADKVTDIQATVQAIQGEVPGLQSGITVVRDQLHAHHQANTQRMVNHAKEQRLAVRLHNEYLERNQEHNTTFDDRMAAMEKSMHMIQAMQALTLLNGASDGLSDDGTNPARIVARFATKPAAFKELCETVSSYGDLEATVHDVIDIQPTWNDPGQSDSRQGSTLAWNSNNKTSCICGRRLRTNMSLEYSQLGSLYLYREVTSRGHYPYCPMYKTLAPKQKRRYGLLYTGLMQAIKGAIDITFNMTSGAGGWSVSPGFRYSPTVDTTQDPAFRVLNVHREFLYKWSHWQWTGLLPDELHTDFHSRATEKIRWLFDNRRTSPLAVDVRNRSLMHEAFEIFG
ncbi:pyruvate decarboxylase [Apiospora saccharicola]|uniref:Pyruvate decarboxylase n=1 Tax=Apiospora saccharicola TaxID=335842 RepID=A0ABR1W4X2_9PEZI